MEVVEGKPKTALLERACSGLRAEHRHGAGDASIAEMNRVLVGGLPVAPGDGQHCVLVHNGRGLKGVVSLKRAAYDKGNEVEYDGRENYINKITWVASRDGGTDCLLAGIVARAILTVGGRNLFIVEVSSADAARVFEDLGFTRICKVANRIRYGYLLADALVAPTIREAQTGLVRSEYLKRMGEAERDYHARLKCRTGFDIVNLLTGGWTTYRQYGNAFLLMVTFGRAGDPAQAAFKVDLFDIQSGSHVGYIDIVLPGTGDFAINDDAIDDFPCVVPLDAKDLLRDVPALNIDSANEARRGWPQREGIWVRVDYRRAGIGQTLERIAGDLCKLAFPGIKAVGVIFPAINIQAYEFHKQAQACDVIDPLYCLEYRLDSPSRPLVAIRHGL